MADLAELTRRFSAFAETTASRAPLYSALSRVVADDNALAGLLGAAPKEQHNPVLLFAAVHDLLLRGLGPDLAVFYPNLATEPTRRGDLASAFRSFVLDHRDHILELVATRSTQTNEVGRCSLFLMALAQLEPELGRLALVEVGASAGLNVLLAHYSYEYQPGGSVGLGRRSISCAERVGAHRFQLRCRWSVRRLASICHRSTCATLTRHVGSKHVCGRISRIVSPAYVVLWKSPADIRPRS